MTALQKPLFLAALIILYKDIATAQSPALVATSGASFEAGLPPKGSIASIFSAGIVGIEQNVSATSFPLPTELAGVHVKIGGVSAPLFSITRIQNYFQIN